MLLYAVTPRQHKNITLLIGSLIFYAYGEPKYILLLLLSIIVNYYMGLHIAGKKRISNEDRTKNNNQKNKGENNKNKSENNQNKNKSPKSSRSKKRKIRRIIFILTIAGNFIVLAFFKLLSKEGKLPLGISFYTFQIVSYLIDAYRGEINKETSLWKLAVYITMFPKLISGPIVSYQEVREQIKERKCTATQVQDGLKVFIAGLSFKVLLADRVGMLWQEVQVTGVESISTILAWIAAIAYSMKIYFDFYGYSLMAVGLGKILGFNLPQNFKEPYMAKGVRDFYRRWHITLGQWFAKYIYIPLGGNRKGELRTIGNLLVVWIFTSIWHGISLNFLIWGLFLWCCIVLERQFEKYKKVKEHTILPHIYLWIVIPVSWICFAITDIKQLFIYLGRMFGIIEGINVNYFDWQNVLHQYGWILLVCIASCTSILRKIFQKGKDTIIGQLIMGGLFWWCVWRIIVEGNNTFMYFGF